MNHGPRAVRDRAARGTIPGRQTPVVMGWLPEAWFQPLAIGSVVASLAGVVLFPIEFPTFGTVGCVVVDLAVLAAATWLHWLPSDLAS